MKTKKLKVEYDNGNVIIFDVYDYDIVNSKLYTSSKPYFAGIAELGVIDMTHMVSVEQILCENELYDLFIEETCDKNGEVDNNYFKYWLKGNTKMILIYNNENGERVSRKYDSVDSFVSEMESDDFDIPMMDYTNVTVETKNVYGNTVGVWFRTIEDAYKSYK